MLVGRSVGLFILFILYNISSLYAQTNHAPGECKHRITADMKYLNAEAAFDNLQAGDTICVAAGVRPRLYIFNLFGQAGKPVTLINCGGQVIIDSNDQLEGAFSVVGSKYFHITGTGSSQHRYGFKVRTNQKGSSMHLNHSDYEIDHVEIADAGFAGIMSKIDPSCDKPEFWRENFVMRNVSIHDNYIHHTHGEGLYIGNTSYFGKSTPCGTLKPHEIHGVKIYNNRIEDTGADGLQLSCAAQDVQVYGNVIKRFGQDPFAPSQNNGLIVGGGSTGQYFNNYIIDGTGPAISCFGMGKLEIFNNLLIKPDAYGIFVDERSGNSNGLSYLIAHNTIIEPGYDGFRIYSQNGTNSRFVNNIIAQPNQKPSATRSYNFTSIKDGVDISLESNLLVNKTSEAGFVAPGSLNYELTSSSSAKDKGKNIAGYTFDYNNQPRPINNIADIGAFEFQNGATPVANQAPTVDAGNDQAYTLPLDKVVLRAKASDADGTISQVQWKQVSGSNLTLGQATSLNLEVSKLVAGSFTFEVNVTDNQGSTASDRVNLTIKEEVVVANQAPTVDAGNDQAYTLPLDKVVLRAKASDADGTISQVQWKQVSGSTLTLGQATSLNLEVSKLVAGSFTFEVNVTDNQGSTASDRVNLTIKDEVVVANQAPTVDAGNDQAYTLPLDKVVLQAEASDADGTVSQVQWKQVSGSTLTLGQATSLNLEVSKLVAGSFTFEVNVTDNQGSTASDRVNLTIKDEVVVANQAPSVSAGSNATYTLPLDKVVLQAKADDTDGSISQVQWTQVSGLALNLAGKSSLTLEVSELVAGIFTFEITVTDNQGSTATDRVDLVIEEVVVVEPTPVVKDSETDQYLYVNFNYGNNASAPWNNYNTNPEIGDKLTNLSDSEGQASGVSLELLSPWGWAADGKSGYNDRGLSTGNNSGAVPDKVLVTNFWTERSEAETVKITGLQSDRMYSFTFTGSRHGSTPRPTWYIINQDTLVLDASSNTNKTVSFENVKPKADGTLEVKVTKPANSQFGYLAAMIIERKQNAVAPSPTLSLIAPENIEVSNITANTASVTWTDNNEYEDGYNLYLSSPGQEPVLYATVGANQTRVNLTELATSTTYSVVVEAYTAEQQAASEAVDFATFKKVGNLLINFNYRDNANSPWNNFDNNPDSGDQLRAINDEDGTESGVIITLTTPWGWQTDGKSGYNNYGEVTGNNSGVYSDQVMKTAFWTQRTEGEKVIISGLEAGRTYNFTFFASRKGTGLRKTHYTINGERVSLEASNNTQNTVTLYNVTPDEHGKLTLEVDKDEQSEFGYLNAMVISPSGSGAFTAANTEAYNSEAKAANTNLNNFTAYPVPASTYVALHYNDLQPGQKLGISLIDMAGQVRLTKSHEVGSTSSDVKLDFNGLGLASGLYIVQIKSQDNTISEAIRIVVQ